MISKHRRPGTAGSGSTLLVGPLRRRARHHDPAPDPHRPAVADDELARRPRRDELPSVHRRNLAVAAGGPWRSFRHDLPALGPRPRRRSPTASGSGCAGRAASAPTTGSAAASPTSATARSSASPRATHSARSTSPSGPAR